VLRGDSAAGLSKLSSASLVDISGRPAGMRRRHYSERSLPRKEVIQPQLPLRLPCYDFTPITSPTFDGSLP
jgi:hypothetical protein